MFGFRFPENFRYPYIATSVQDFWTRWHISLSTWFRDYLYIPLGGNRRSRARVYLNLTTVFFLCGLWHGAAWTFVAWGAGHGLALAAHRWWRARRPAPAAGFRTRYVAPVATLALVTLLWVPFRAPSFEVARTYLGGIADLRGGPVNLDDVLVVALAGLGALGLDLLQRRAREQGVDALLPRLPVLRPVAVGVATLAVVAWSGGTPVQFLYFQF
jgi:alginate O-acetyltransferase complex protein AlgI